LVDTGLLAILFIAPLFMGGRYPVGRLVLVTLIVLVTVGWAVRTATAAVPRWQRTSATWLLAGCVTLVVLQWVPLPAAILRTVSPQLGKLLPVWTTSRHVPIELGTWSRITLAPEATRQGLALLLAYAMLFLVVIQRLRAVDDVYRMLRWIGAATVWMAVLGIAQYLMSNGKFLWLYDHPFRNTSQYVTGSFINRNHFAHLLALGVGPLALLLADGLRKGATTRGRGFGERTVSREAFNLHTALPAIALGIVLFAGLMSLSRGGTIAMAVALLVVSVGLYRCRLLDRSYITALLGASLLLGLSLFIVGGDRVTERLEDLTSGSLDRLDPQEARRAIWAANLAIVHDFPLTGTGAGSHRDICPTYLTRSYAVEYTHAESGYLQVATEAGMMGIGLLAAGILLCGTWCCRSLWIGTSPHILACSAAVTAGLTASMVHATVDFVWYIPACMSVTVILIACAQRLHGLARESESATVNVPTRVSRPLCIAWAGFALLLGLWMISSLLPPALASPAWDQYLRVSIQATADRRKQMGSASDGTDCGERRRAAAMTAAMISQLKRVLHRDPADARAHFRLAGLYLTQFEERQRKSDNAMDLSQIRDAAIASHFPSSDALYEWLKRAVGDRRRLLDLAAWHAREGLVLAPLHAEGYLDLAELCFLGGADDAEKGALVDQALRVRPHDADVLFAAGREAVLAGAMAKAVAYWRESFRNDGPSQWKLIQLLAGRVPVSFFLDSLQADLTAMRRLAIAYRGLNLPSQRTALNRRLADQAARQAAVARGEQAVTLWLEAHRAYQETGLIPQATWSVRRAVAFAPYDYKVRYVAGVWFYRQHRFEEAESHLRWCLHRRPHDVALQKLVHGAVTGRIEGPPAAVSRREHPTHLIR